jgi:hypothetical protein
MIEQTRGSRKMRRKPIYAKEVKRMEGKERNVAFRRLVDFPSTTYGTFCLYSYPAKFIPHVIGYVFENYATRHMKIFDPFAGYGTVGIVSRIYGYDYELWDLNPMLKTLHSVAILQPKAVDVKDALRQMALSNEEFVPEWSGIDYWFPEEFLPFLYKTWGFYHSLEDKYTKLLLTIPLLKTSRYFSFDDIQRQKLSKSFVSEKRVNSLLDSNWRTKFFEMLQREMEKMIRRVTEYSTLSPKKTRSVVKCGVDILTTNLDEQKDILISSPPYLQSQEYIRQAKMDLFWLGYSEEKVRQLKRLEIPYRAVEPQPINSKTFESFRKQIKEDHLKTIFNRYFWGTLGALTRLQKGVNSYLCLLLGRTSMRGCPVPIDNIFKEHFVELGWTHETTLVDTIVSSRMFFYQVNPATKLNHSRTSAEHLLILRKN